VPTSYGRALPDGRSRLQRRCGRTSSGDQCRRHPRCRMTSSTSRAGSGRSCPRAGMRTGPSDYQS